MKPEILKLQGFITYRDPVEIDFRKFQEDKIFMICGPTGSGKTSLFDAICFALYGQVSTDVRGSDESLRCDFLTPGDPQTFVEFTFSKGGHRYTVVRYPAQHRQRRTGAITMESSRAQLYQDDHYMDLGRVKEVNEKIEEILGLTKDQFTKIVMLPQGEFARFLASPSKEKEIILRKIFGTWQYEAFGAAAKKKKDEAEKKISVLRLGVDRILEALDIQTKGALQDYLTQGGTADLSFLHQLAPQLEEEEKAAKSKEEQIQTQLEETQLTLEQSQQQWTLAQARNKELEELDLVKSQLDQQLKEQAEKEQKKERIALAKEARHLKPLEDAWKRSDDKAKKIWQDLLAQEKQCVFLEKEATHWAALEQELPGRREELDRLREQGLQLKEERQVFEEMQKRLLEQKDGQRQLQKLDRSLKQKQAERIRTGEERTALAHLEEETMLLQKQQQDTRRRLYDMQLYETQLQALEDLLQRKKNLQGSMEKERHRLKEAGQEEKRLQSLVDSQEERWKEQGLYPYASQVEEGKPCPLCGSVHHPRPLEIKEELKGKELEANRRKLMQAAGDAKAAESLLLHGEQEALQWEGDLKKLRQSIQIEASSLEELKKERSVLEEEKTTCQRHWQELEDQEKNLQEQRQRQKALEEQSQTLEQELKALELEQNTAMEKNKHLELRLEEDRKKVTSFSTAEEGEAKLLALRESYARLDKEIQHILQKSGDSRTALAQSRATLENLQRNHQEEENRKKTEEAEFEAKRMEKFSSTQAYRRIQEQAQELLDEEKDNQEFFRELDKRKQHHGLLEAKLEGKEKQDLEKMQEEIRLLRQRQKEDQEKRELLHLRRAHLQEWAKQMKELARQIQGTLHEQQTAAQLHELCKGDNPRSLSFETYVLLWYFDDVLDYANQRLYQISGGRYELNRREENQKERGQNKGLEIAVLDANTGKERGSSTLSGGESFLVSLSLALGLSDAMTGAVGGVEIGALFIDEGFGTLDQDKLQSAVDCLVQLTSANRIIGIISHVEELKESIPGKIRVTYDKEKGSSAQIL